MAPLRAAASPNPVDFVKWVRISHRPSQKDQPPLWGADFLENDCDSNKTGVIVKFRNAWILFATVEVFYRIKEVSILHRII